MTRKAPDTERHRPEISSIGAGEAGAERLSLTVISAYAMPRVAFAVMGAVMGVYFMKYSTDVLLIAPAAIGIIMAVIGGPFFLWILLRRRGLVDM